jgi:hypothetical protein
MNQQPEPVNTLQKIPTTAEAAMILIAERALNVEEIGAFVAKVREIHRDILKPGEDYGVIPGTGKASLWQPGAEKLCMGLRFRPELSAVRIPDGEEITYEGHCRLVHIPSGLVIAESTAVCSSAEEKYAWRDARSVVSKEEFERLQKFEPSRVRLKFKRGYRGAPDEEIPQIRTNPADIANTVCRMAQKRAHVGTTKTATAASGIYTTDAEELNTAGIDLSDYQNGNGSSKPPIQQPKAKDLPADAVKRLADAFVPEAWDEILAAAKNASTTAVVGPGQVATLLTFAERSGWQMEEARAVVRSKLSLELEQLPDAAVFHKLCDAFKAFGPKR